MKIGWSVLESAHYSKTILFTAWRRQPGNPGATFFLSEYSSIFAGSRVYQVDHTCADTEQEVIMRIRDIKSIILQHDMEEEPGFVQRYFIRK